MNFSENFLYPAIGLLTAIIIYSIVKVFNALGFVDRPDGIRKTHKGDIAYGGGVALFLSCSVVFFILFPDYSLGSFGAYPELSYIWVISVIILLLGLWDDIEPLSPSIRIIFQIFASWLVIITTDLYVSDLGDLLGLGNIFLGDFGIPITIFMVVGMCNAFNMLDGMDGLVCLVLLVPASALALLAYLNGSHGLIFLGSIILSIFLIFNLGLLGKKVKIFLGDSGSLWLGFITAWFLICFSQIRDEESLLDPVTCLWLTIIPLIDALSTFINRISNKASIFSGDRSHLHHMLLDRGLKKWKVLFIFLVLSIFSSMAALVFSHLDINESKQFYGFLTIWFFYFLLFKYPLFSKSPE